MSFYGTTGWGGYGMQGATQNASFFGVHNAPRHQRNPSFNGSMQNVGSFYNGMHRPGSSYAPTAPTPRPYTAAVAAVPSAPLAAVSQTTSHNSSFAASAGTDAPFTPDPPAASATPDSSTTSESPPALRRHNSSGRLLRRRVSFSGIPHNLPPEVEMPNTSPTPKRQGSRRLSISPSNAGAAVEDRKQRVHTQPPQGQQQQLQQEQQQQLCGHPRHVEEPVEEYYVTGLDTSGELQLAAPDAVEVPRFVPPQQQHQLPQHQHQHQQQQFQQQHFQLQQHQHQQQQQQQQLQQTVATSGPANASQYGGSFHRRGSVQPMAMPPNPMFAPNMFVPHMQNYGMAPFGRPMCPPNVNMYQGMPHGMYPNNMRMSQRPIGPNYF